MSGEVRRSDPAPGRSATVGWLGGRRHGAPPPPRRPGDGPTVRLPESCIVNRGFVSTWPLWIIGRKTRAKRTADMHSAASALVEACFNAQVKVGEIAAFGVEMAD